MFAIDVERARVLEWSASLDTWSVLDDSAHIEDPALGAALPIDVLIRTAGTDDAVARALLVKHNPVLEDVKAQHHAEGRIEGMALGSVEALLVLLGVRGIAVDGAAQERILRERDPQRLERWISRAASCTTLAEIFTEDRAGSR